MDKNGLLDMRILSFVFMPLVGMVALLLGIWWNRVKDSRVVLPAASAMDKPELLLTGCCLLAGLPLGLAGLLRRERLRWLSVLGMLSSLCISGYFLLVMHFFAGGPHGD